MSELTVIDAIPTAKVMQELKAKRTSFYKAIADLKISTFMDGKTSMLKLDDAKRLQEHYQMKGDTMDLKGLSTVSLGELYKQTNTRTNDITLLIQALSGFIPQPVHDPFFIQRHLQEACDQKWALSTDQVAQLLGRSLDSIRRNHRITEYGFKLESLGWGRSRRWEISKIPQNVETLRD